MNRRLAAIAVALAVVIALASGCGGGGDDGLDRLTKPEFVKQANAVCKDFNARFAALPAPQGSAARADYVRTIEKISRAYVTKLRSLVPPKDVEDAMLEAYDALDQEIALFPELARAETDGDEGRAAELSTTLGELNARAAAATKDVGIAECSGS